MSPRIPSPDDDALLDRARLQHEATVAEAWPATAGLIESCAPDKAADHLANLETFVPLLAQLCRDEHVASEREGIRLGTELMYFLGEYLRQRFSGAWVLDDVPFSSSFARSVIEVPVDHMGSIRVDVARMAVDYLKVPPPRDLYSELTPLLERITKARTAR